jgi:hypothetical protein
MAVSKSRQGDFVGGKEEGGEETVHQDRVMFIFIG